MASQELLTGPTDPLTGAFSRAYFTVKVEEEFERASRYRLPFALLVLDLDHFKSINDAFGHSRGDQVLVEFVQRARKTVRASDFIFRYGGDEFVLLLPHTTRLEAANLANRLLENVKTTPVMGEPPVSISISVGVAAFPEDGATYQAIFEKADQRNYAAKRAGRACLIADDFSLSLEPVKLEAPGRLLEREYALEKLHIFLEALPGEGQGLFVVQGAEGTGHSRFLEEVRKAGRLRGYAVLNLRGQPALKVRRYGVLSAALASEQVPPSRVASAEALILTISGWLESKSSKGLLVTVDDPADVDPASYNFLIELSKANRFSVLGICFAGKGIASLVTQPFNFNLKMSVNLPLLSQAALQVWLRHALKGEVSTRLVNWFHRQTAGFPALIRAGLEILLEHKKLKRQGSNWIWVLEDAETLLAEKFEQRKAAPPNNLPGGLAELVGREIEIQQLDNLLAHHQLVTILGPGGIGKTRLALQIALENLRHYQGGVFFVPLATGDPEEESVAGAIAVALGLKAGEGSRKQLLVNYLKNKQVLLVLDNFEHLVEKSGWLNGLLEEADQLKILVTTREELKLPGERVLTLEGLTYPQHPLEIEPVELEGYSAVQLFIQLVDQFELDRENGQALARICRIVRGIPLGLKLVAAWVGVFSVEEIAQKLEERALELLGESGGLWQVFEALWDLLSAYEQSTFAGLAVFRGGFSREAAAEVCGASTFFLEGLVNRAFLRRNQVGRYELHELVRQYLVAKTSPEQQALTKERHASYYLKWLEKLGPRTSQTWRRENLALLKLEYADLKAGLEWFYEQGRVSEALRIAIILHPFWYLYGYWAEGLCYLERGLNSPPELEDSLRAKAMIAIGHLALDQGDYETATKLLQTSLEINQAVGNREQVGRSLSYLGILALHRGNYQEAVDYLEQTLPITREVNDRNGLIIDLLQLGLAATGLGNYSQAKKYHEESLELSRELDVPRGIGANLQALGDISLIEADFTTAQHYYRQSLEMLEQGQNKAGLVYVLSANANLAVKRACTEPMPERIASFERAARLLGGLANLLSTYAITLDALERPRYESASELTRENLSQKAFEQAFRAGAALSLKQLIQCLHNENLVGPTNKQTD